MPNGTSMEQAKSEEDIWNALSEKTNFASTPEQWNEFVKLLDNPPEINPAMNRTLNTIPPWE